jgi:Luciferase-like monooxygenase
MVATLPTEVGRAPPQSEFQLTRSGNTTLDILSNGRLVVGLGQGWSKDEYDAAGASWSDRGRRFEEAVEALKAVWTTDPVEFRGNFYSIPKSYVSFKPVQKPHPPIYMAAYTPAAMGRVARHADGWHPVGIPLPNVAQMFEKLRSMVDEVGRDGSALELIVRANATITEEPLDGNRWDFSGSADQVGEDIAKARKIGATGVGDRRDLRPCRESSRRHRRATGALRAHRDGGRPERGAATVGWPACRCEGRPPHQRLFTPPRAASVCLSLRRTSDFRSRAPPGRPSTAR